MTIEGCCPNCGATIGQTDINGRLIDPLVTAKTLDLRALARTDGQDEKAPWHFKLLVSALVIYISWRVVSLFI